MTRRSAPAFLAVAGALRAPAAFLALGLIVGTTPAVFADSPVRYQPPTTPDGATVPPAAPLAPGALSAAGPTPSLGVPTTGVLPLRSLAAQSTVIARGVVVATDSIDEDRLRVYHLSVDAALKGSVPDGGAAIVEMRGATSRPGLLADGTRALVFLRAAPPLSYLTQHLPEGRTHFALTGGRDGIVPVASDAEAGLVEMLLAEGMRIQGLKDEDAVRRARRGLAFRELATTQPRLAADALVELRGLDDTDRPTGDEIAVLAKALQATTIPGPTRAALIHLAGKRGWKEAVPALRTAAIDSPVVLDAVLTARTQLGVPATKRELDEYLAAKDPAIRAAAIRALTALGEPGLPELERFATTDADVQVRVAAIEALGNTKSPAVVATLSQTFGDSTREVRQASGRALLAIGGAVSGNALVDLALRGKDAETRSYAAILLLVSQGRDSADVQRLLAANPSGEVREVIEHGLKGQH